MTGIRASVIVTGVSRGLGAALFDQLADAGHRVLGVGRGFTAEQHRLADKCPEQIRLCDADLAKAASVPDTATIADFLAPAGDAPVVLLHNAAVITPLGMVGALDVDEIVRAVAVNLTAAMILTNNLLAVRPPNADTRIILVSSRAAEVPKEGQAMYCATKAGAEMFFRVVAREAAADSRISVQSVRTPAMDTGMQAVIRASADLPDRAHFVGRYQRGELSDPAEIARKIIAEHVDRTR